MDKVLFVNQVHDENVVECPNDMAEEVKQALYTAMINSGKLYCKRVPLKVDPGITQYWKK